MATFHPAFRVRVYAPRSVDPTETTVLTPAAGAPHSDPFQYATHAISGHKAYLKPPRGRQETMDLLTRVLKGGGMTLDFLDKRVTVGGSHAARHLSAFLGNAAGQPVLLGCKLEMDFCEDITAGTPTWTRWITHRIDALHTNRGTALSLDTVDGSQEMDTKLFYGRAHSSVTYASESQLWPVGRSADYGPFRATAVVLRGTYVAHSTGIGRIDLTAASQGELTNFYTKDLQDTGVPFSLSPDWTHTRFTSSVAVRVKQTSGGSSGTIGDYDLGGLLFSTGLVKRPPYALTGLYLRAKPGGTAVPGNGVSVEVSIRRPAQPVTKSVPLMLSDAHPVQRIKDALDGKFSLLAADGSVLSAWPYDSTSVSTLLADTTFQSLRSIEEKPITLRDFLARECRQSGLGYYLNAEGKVVLVDLRFPTSVSGVPTITEADLVARDIPAWSLSRGNAVTQFEMTWYTETALPPEEVRNGSIEGRAVVVSSGALVTAAPRTLFDYDTTRLDFGSKDFQLDATGIRVAAEETENGLPRETTTISRILGLIEDLRNPFGYGPQETTLTCRRTTVPKGLVQGQLAFVTADRLPNPGTNQRGGTRLVRVMEKQDNGPTIVLQVLDMGPNAVLNAPTVGTISQETGNTAGGITVPITRNAQGDPVTVQVATTDTSVATVGAVPAVKWSRVYRLTSDQTLTIRPLPAASRVWVRARSEVGSGSVSRIPSAWAYSTGTDYVDLTGLTAPSGLSVGSVTSGSALLSFTNGDTVFAVELLLESPSGDGLVSARFYPAGTTQIQLTGLTSGASYGAAVRLNDGSGGVSASSSTVTWTATGTMPVAPLPLVIETVGGTL